MFSNYRTFKRNDKKIIEFSKSKETDKQRMIRERVDEVYNYVVDMRTFHYENVGQKRNNNGHLKFKEDEKKMSWNYIPSRGAGTLVNLLKGIGVYSLYDLGCGAGLLLHMIKVNSQISVGGMDINPKALKMCKQLMPAYAHNFSKGDITKVNKRTLKKYDAIYFYEPLIDKVQCEEFSVNLHKNTNDNQIIIYRSAGHMGKYLSKRFKMLCRYGAFEIFVRKP